MTHEPPAPLQSVTLVACPKCRRQLMPEPDGTIFCVECVRPRWWDNLVSIFKPTTGWAEIGHILGAVGVAVVMLGCAVLWRVVLFGTRSYGLKSDAGGFLTALAVEAGVAGLSGFLLRSLKEKLPGAALMAIWVVVNIAIPALLIFLRG